MTAPMVACGEMPEIEVGLPESDKRVPVPDRVVMDRPGREVMVATVSVYVLAWAVSRASEASGELVVGTIRELCGAEGRPLGHNAARDALAEATRRGYVTRRRDPGLGYVYAPVEPEPGAYVMYIDAYSWARRDVSVAARAAYAVVAAHMTTEATSRRLDGRTLSEYLGVAPRTACAHVRALTEGPVPLLTHIDITTEGQRWKIHRTRAGQEAGKAALIAAVRKNHRRTPLVACWRAHTSADTPLSEIAPLYRATTVGGFLGVRVSRITKFRRKKRPSSHQKRTLPRRHRRPETQERLDKLWELLDHDHQHGWTVASPDQIATDLGRRSDLGTVCDAVLTTYALLASGADIHQPLAFARSLVVCFRHPQRCPQRHHGPCGELRRIVGRVRFHEWTHEQFKTQAETTAQTTAPQLIDAVGDLSTWSGDALSALIAAAPVLTNQVAETVAAPRGEEEAWEQWHRTQTPPTDAYDIGQALEALPRHLRDHREAETWALNVARNNIRRTLGGSR